MGPEREGYFPALKQAPLFDPVILILERERSYVAANMSPIVAASSASEFAFVWLSGAL